MIISGRHYDEVTVGETFTAAMTITETHLVLAAGLIGDFHPLHVNEQYAAQTRYGGRVLHGVFTSAVMGGPLGNVFAGTGVAYMEHNCRFRNPVRPGDTITTVWTVAEMTDKPQHGGGVIALTAVARNQGDEVVAEAEARLLVRSRPA